MRDDDRCETCGEDEIDCRCVPPVIPGQEELFDPGEPEGEPEKGGPEWA